MKKIGFILSLTLFCGSFSYAKCNGSQSWVKASTVDAGQWIAWLTVGHKFAPAFASSCQIEIADESQKEGKLLVVTATEKTMGVLTNSLSFSAVGEMKARVCDETNEVLAVGGVRADRYMMVVFDAAYGEPVGVTITNTKNLESVKCGFVK